MNISYARGGSIQLVFRIVYYNKKMKILIIEDEQRIARTIKKGLENEGHAVDAVYDGESGLDMASVEVYDVIVLDRMLPGIDGEVVCKRIREQKIHTPILMLTAKSQLIDKVSGLDAGADDYLSKPFAFEELLARLRALSRRPQKTQDEKIHIGPLLLNVSARMLMFENKPVKLSRKEFAIIEYLMKNPNKVISKQDIIDKAWNFDADILPNTVEVNIRNIRRKIGNDAIATIRGFGYKITSNYLQ